MSEKIKVCHLTSVHPPFDVRIFHKECKTLAKAGYDVVLIAGHGKDEFIDGINIKSIKKPLNRKERIIKTGWLVYKKALEENADIYHIHDPELIPYAKLLRIKGKKVIYDMHENLPKSILTKTWIKQFLRPILSTSVNLIERLLLKKVFVIFAEKSYKKDYVWVKKHEDILNMPDVENLFKLKLTKKDKFTLGYIGGVSDVRGSLSTIEAMKKLKDKGYDVNLECIGPIEHYHEQEINHLIKKYNLDGLKLYGYLPPEKGWEIIAQCHVGLAVLKPIPNYYESYPTKMFEYMALGLPVIASNFPIYKEIIEKNNCGICVDPLNVEEIADAVKWIIDHPEEAKRMGENGRRAVEEKYNWEKEGEKLVNIYKELLS
jgi:glycosyltransferase involved in cell wall biosynthesis